MAAACGDPSSTPPIDGPSADGARDAAPDAAFGPVSVTVLDPDGAPVAGARVVFTSGGATTLSTTDGSGAATANVGDNATITAVVRSMPRARIYTTFGAKPGDHLRYGGRRSGPGPTSVTPRVQWTAPSFAMTYVSLLTQCGLNGGSGALTSLELPIGDRCPGPHDIVAYVGNATDRAFQVLSNVAPTAADIILPGPWMSGTTSPVTVTGIPQSDARNAGYTQTLHGLEVAGNINLPGSAVTPAGITGAAPTLPIAGSTFTTFARMYAGDTLYGSQETRTTVPFVGGAITADVGATILPYLRAGFDMSTRTVSWFAQGTGTPDLVVFDVDYGIAWWTTYGPALTGAMLQLPDLPAELDDIEPPAAPMGTISSGNFRWFRFMGRSWDDVRDEVSLNLMLDRHTLHTLPGMTQVNLSSLTRPATN